MYTCYGLIKCDIVVVCCSFDFKVIPQASYEKKVLNSGGQQFHHYQQNKQPPFTSYTQKKTTSYGIGIRPGLGQETKLTRHS